MSLEILRRDNLDAYIESLEEEENREGVPIEMWRALR